MARWNRRYKLLYNPTQQKFPRRWERPFEALVHAEGKSSLPRTIDSGVKFAAFFKDFDPIAIIVGHCLSSGEGRGFNRTKMITARVCFRELRTLEEFIERWDNQELDGNTIYVVNRTIVIQATRPRAMRSAIVNNETKHLFKKATKLKRRTERMWRNVERYDEEYASPSSSSAGSASLPKRKRQPQAALRSLQLLKEKKQDEIVGYNCHRLRAGPSSDEDYCPEENESNSGEIAEKDDTDENGSVDDNDWP